MWYNAIHKPAAGLVQRLSSGYSVESGKELARRFFITKFTKMKVTLIISVQESLQIYKNESNELTRKSN
jgi:hypothetical protein